MSALLSVLKVILVATPTIIIWHRYGAPRVVSWLKKRHDPWNEFERKQK